MWVVIIFMCFLVSIGPHRVNLLLTLTVTTCLERVSDGEDVLESDELLVDGQNTEQPRDSEHWQNHQNVPHRRPVDTTSKRCGSRGGVTSHPPWRGSLFHAIIMRAT